MGVMRAIRVGLFQAVSNQYRQTNDFRPPAQGCLYVAGSIGCNAMLIYTVPQNVFY